MSHQCTLIAYFTSSGASPKSFPLIAGEREKIQNKDVVYPVTPPQELLLGHPSRYYRYFQLLLLHYCPAHYNLSHPGSAHWHL